MRSDVAGADDERGFAVGADDAAGVLPCGVRVADGVDVQVFHDGPHHGEHVFGHALSVGSGGVGEHGAGVEHARPLVFVDAGAPGLQPFEFGTLSACSRINIADDGGDLSFELFGDDGRPCHVATLCRIAYEFLRHAFGCTHKLRLLGWRQRQAIDDKFAVILDSHPSRLRTDMR